MSSLKDYQVLYRKDDGEEEVEQVPAYTKEQAKFLASCRSEQILGIEEAVSKGRGYC